MLAVSMNCPRPRGKRHTPFVPHPLPNPSPSHRRRSWCPALPLKLEVRYCPKVGISYQSPFSYVRINHRGPLALHRPANAERGSTTRHAPPVRPSAVSHTASLPCSDGMSAMVHFFMLLSFPRSCCSHFYQYECVRAHQRFTRLSPGNPSPKHFKTRGPVHLGPFWLPHHEFHRHLCERGQRRPDEGLRNIPVYLLCHRILRHPLNFNEGGESGLLRLLCQPGPDLNLLEDPLLFRVCDAPLQVAAPDVVQSMPHALFSRETGHDRIR